jgi:predicted RNA-binding protein YlxR (DUF448 family)
MAQPQPTHKTKPGRPQRKLPVRTCIACQEAKTKRELVRIVHTPAGTIEVDATGKKAGRGAYMCPKKSCWELGFKKHAIERALKTTISPENQRLLEEYAAGLP